MQAVAILARATSVWLDESIYFTWATSEVLSIWLELSLVLAWAKSSVTRQWRSLPFNNIYNIFLDSISYQFDLWVVWTGQDSSGHPGLFQVSWCHGWIYLLFQMDTRKIF